MHTSLQNSGIVKARVGPRCVFLGWPLEAFTALWCFLRKVEAHARPCSITQKYNLDQDVFFGVATRGFYSALVFFGEGGGPCAPLQHNPKVHLRPRCVIWGGH